VLLLLDGLDEVPPQTDGTQADRQTTGEVIRAFGLLYHRVSLVVTCRVRAFTPDIRATLGWHVEELAPFTLGQVREFVPAWYSELVAKRQLTQERATPLGQHLIERIAGNRQLCEMAATPLLLTMMALVLYNKGDLPRDRPLLYEQILEVLLGQWDKLEKDRKTLTEVIGKPEWDSKELRPPLHQLSYTAHAEGSEDGRGRLRREAVRDALIGFFEDARLPTAWETARQCLEYIDQRSGLLLPDANGTYVFAHLTLQEHCAGCHMLLERDDALEQVMQHRGDDRWYEPIMLGLGMADSPVQRDVLEALLDRQEQGRDKPIARWYRDLILAAEIGWDRDWNILRTRAGIKRQVEQLQTQLRAGLATLLNDAEQPLPVRERVRAGFLLGDLGDPRFPVTPQEWQREWERAQAGDPNGYFCKVDAGTYLIGSSDDDPDADDDEKPQHTVTFEHPFWVARYPLTNAQWQAWVEAGGQQSSYWDASDLNRPNQPVVGVSWTTCNEFCRWIQEQTGVEIHLPTEAQWEAAARGGDGRRYPWGDAWQADCAATAEDEETRGSRWSVPVGCYPAGASPAGVLDMAGNVREWTADVSQSHPGAAEPFEEQNSRVQKGGDYSSSSTYVRCAARFRHPLAFALSRGVRVGVSPRLSERMC
jgi:formylglycine-generating enzyme required for sulfatase activity